MQYELNVYHQLNWHDPLCCYFFGRNCSLEHVLCLPHFFHDGLDFHSDRLVVFFPYDYLGQYLLLISKMKIYLLELELMVWFEINQ